MWTVIIFRWTFAFPSHLVISPTHGLPQSLSRQSFPPTPNIPGRYFQTEILKGKSSFFGQERFTLPNCLSEFNDPECLHKLKGKLFLHIWKMGDLAFRIAVRKITTRDVWGKMTGVGMTGGSGMAFIFHVPLCAVECQKGRITPPPIMYWSIWLW